MLSTRVSLLLSRAKATATTTTATAAVTSGRRMLTSGIVQVPKHARVVVIGGGVIGTSIGTYLHCLHCIALHGVCVILYSILLCFTYNKFFLFLLNLHAIIAYHLAQLGWDNIVLLEQSKLTSGTTWHAAGLMVTFGSKSETVTDIRKYSKHLYSTLEEETGLSTGFKPVGFIEVATDMGRLEEYRRISDFNRKCGIDVHEISPAEILKLFPLAKVDDVLAGFYVPTDGRVNPVDLTMSLAKGARMKGALLLEDVEVIDVLHNGKRVTGVSTTHGDIQADYVVNCAGMWARQLGEKSGVNIPNQAAEHYYMITDKMPDVDPNWPVLEDPSSYTYIRPEAGGLMVGLFESKAAPWNVNKIPKEFTFGEIDPDWDRMSPFLEKAMSRVPRTMESGIMKFFCGPESFTPDLAPIVGEAPELKNYFVCAGLNSIGIISGGGLGRIMANWIVNGKPDVDVTGFNIDRLQRYQNTPKYRSDRVTEALGMVYKCHYPAYAVTSARGVKRSPIHHKLVDQGALFRDVSGWEGADWFAGEGRTASEQPLSWGKHHWFANWKEEHDAVRKNVGLIDMSFMSKFLVQGRDAGKMLNYLSTAEVDGEAGRIVYTQWLDSDGKMQADITVCKLSDGRFMVVATDTAHRHVEAIMNHYVRDKEEGGEEPCIVVTDGTGGLAQLNIQGPKSRELLASLTESDVSDEAFPFRQAVDIPIGYATVLCVRITYVGELGYELYVPAEHAVHVYEQILERGKEFNLRHVGLKALGSLRMEKGYRDFGHDMDNTDSLLEVGLGFTCDFGKPSGFRGMDKVLEQKKEGISGLKQRLVQVLINGHPDVMMYHAEIVYRDGVCVGDIRAASYGHTLGGALGLAMVHASTGENISKKYLDSGKWEVEVAGKKYPAVASLQPMYDPSNIKIKG
jgi:glycine cleavage system aminomethyltransferase T/glycine/D-amino acid oxidase-like deaminating enzyme